MSIHVYEGSGKDIRMRATIQKESYLMGTVSNTGNGTAKMRRRGRSHPGLPSSSSGGSGERQDTEDKRQGRGSLGNMEQKQSINITNIKSLNFRKMSPRGEHL